MSDEASAIPVGTQFTPQLVDLSNFLRSLLRNSGDKTQMQAAIWQQPTNLRKQPRLPTSERQRNLPLEAAIQYGLLDAEYRATELCESLAAKSGQQLYDQFARHILLTLGGLRVVEGIQQMQADGHKVTADSLAAYLTDQGFRIAVHNTAINSMRLWLARAGLFPESRARAWEIDQDRKSYLVGLEDDTIATLAGLTPDQRAFVAALCRVDPQGAYPASEIRDLAESIIGHRLNRGNLPKNFLEPLRLAGLIQYQARGTSSGKTSTLTTTDMFRKEILADFLENTLKTLDTALTAYYVKPIAEIYSELCSDNPNVKGAALEAYAIHVMRLLGLRFVAWRKRAREETGQAEIDVVMSGLVGGIATRWQIQCKNKPSGRVSLEDVAKEVGLTPLTKATHVMVLANCRVTQSARDYAREIMRNSSLTIMLLDRDNFDMIRVSPASIASIIHAKSRLVESIDRHGFSWHS